MYANMMDTIGFVSQFDPEVGQAMNEELGRQRRNLELIASENLVSPAVMAAMGSALTNKYAEGLPHKRYYGGCEYVDVVEEIAIERACKLFGAKYANVQPHSGAQANTAVYFALLQPGDTVMGMSLAHGGHLTHGSPVNISGKYFNFVPYELGDDEYIDYDRAEALAKEVKPKLIVAGASAYPRIIDFKRLSEIAKSVGAYLMVDMAHIAGLGAAGVHPSPVPYADITTTTTHKTLRGPRGGLILTNDEELAKKINKAVFPGTQGGPLMHVIAAKAVCFGEALKPEFQTYGKTVVANASALADGLMQRGFRLVSGGTDNHLMLVDLRSVHHRQQECNPQRPAEAVRYQRYPRRYTGSYYPRFAAGRYGNYCTGNVPRRFRLREQGRGSSRECLRAVQEVPAVRINHAHTPCRSDSPQHAGRCGRTTAAARRRKASAANY